METVGGKDANDVIGDIREEEYDLLELVELLLAIILAGEKILFTQVGDFSLLLGDDFTGENVLLTTFELEILFNGIYDLMEAGRL